MIIFAYIIKDQNNKDVLCGARFREYVPTGVDYQEVEVPYWPGSLKQDSNGVISFDNEHEIFTYRRRQKERIKHAFYGALETTFFSEALGQKYLYQADTRSVDLIVKQAETGGYLWCVSEDGSIKFVKHSTEQISQILKDYQNHIDVVSAKCSDLMNKIESETDIIKIRSIIW